MLQEEAESFSQVHETGNAEGLQMNINLTYPTPVQKNNTAVPRPLYPEVKQYVEDLLEDGSEVTFSLFFTSWLCVEKGRNTSVMYRL